jgi:hypothetical protein
VEILELLVPRLYFHSPLCRSLCPLLITSRHGPHRKHCYSIVVFMSVATGKCLQSHCPEMAATRTTENTVLLLFCACMFQALPSSSLCLQSNCLATGPYATLLFSPVMVLF